MPPEADNAWFPGPRVSGGAATTRTRLRVFAFPYAGGGTRIFHGWEASLPAGVELWPARLPGREYRISESAFDRHEPLIDELLPAIAGLLDRPYVLLGHSMGTILGYELARRLRDEGLPPPELLVMSGRQAPHVPDTDPPLADLPREEFIEQLRRYDGTPEAVLQSQELMDFVIPLLRADFALCERYGHQPGPKLACPIAAYGGLTDPDVDRPSLEAWAEVTTGETVARMLPGGHFFIDEIRQDYLATLNRDLARVLGGEGAG